MENDGRVLEGVFDSAEKRTRAEQQNDYIPAADDDIYE